MKKNNLLPILLVAGAGFAAFMYFKNKGKKKEIADGVDIEPIENKTTIEDQTTTTSEESEPQESKVDTYIKSGTSILNKAKQLIRGRKKRKSRVIVEPTQSSSTPFPETPTTRKNRRLAKRTARTTKRATRKQARTAKRLTRKNKVVTGFEF